MLNRVTVMGRLVKDPELRKTSSGIACCSFRIACDRNVKSKDAEKKTDFIPCVAWRHNAEFVAQYFRQGKTIVVDGSIQQREYTTKDGEKRQILEIVADDVFFGDSRKNEDTGYSSNGGYSGSYTASSDAGPGFSEVDDDNGELPF